ncbi:DUF551 domain-containing protein [Escherichia coli]|uniref:DUF551 domain-containing protein n=1 Tax=Escherichia coli TaxID=562 RepID=UPI000B7D8F52|nr:DUF551 domain-containing protein [Escherichia coli]EJW6187439.1 DUF551 domain-containing protein [Escherichia coli]MEC9844232.1 DUF551 domain-containing protein [Escherichia coli]MEC9907560.1 DUF551 domain-containing protein [Escherichia coli]MED0568545.1 DUF551 domain-containing protein [Escherichia coli]HAY0564421.1 DUF551 domain-containing protein [Escherichia coli]
MTTITDKKQYPGEQYLNELITNIEFAARAPVEVVRAMAAELRKRREADSAEPVSQTYKLPPLSSSEVNDAAWKLHNMLTEHGPLNGRQFNNLKGCFYEALKVAMRNYPVTPDSWISCSERMPEKGQNVLISVNFDSSLVEPLICSARYTGSTFRRGDATIKPGNGIEQATHWMPLPEPPQEAK